MDKTNLDRKILGQRIRTARERANFQQLELATHLSLNQRAISEMENGRRKVDVLELALIADATQVPISYFFEGESRLSDFEELFLKQIERLNTDKDKQNALDFFQFFCDVINQYS